MASVDDTKGTGLDAGAPVRTGFLRTRVVVRRLVSALLRKRDCVPVMVPLVVVPSAVE